MATFSSDEDVAAPMPPVSDELHGERLIRGGATYSETSDEEIVSRKNKCGKQLAKVLEGMHDKINSLNKHDADGLRSLMLRAFPACGSVDGTRATPLIISGLTGINTNTVRAVLRTAKFGKKCVHGKLKTRRCKVLKQCSGEAPAAAAQESKTRRQRIMIMLVRQALGIGRSNRTCHTFLENCMRLETEGNDVGQKFHYGKFCKAVINEGGRLVDFLVRDANTGIHSAVPALGIPSDVEIIYDGVNVVKTKACPFGKMEAFLVGAMPCTDRPPEVTDVGGI